MTQKEAVCNKNEEIRFVHIYFSLYLFFGNLKSSVFFMDEYVLPL
ncbi:hypothetical protein C2W64_02263 [Brevibacillus laterosporus]|nr:hypothetical protein C2W64_02263 [Brevibacillus laterosporus]